jgi:deazaflavin-dependent oxidoreductase (nitroreductase family)
VTRAARALVVSMLGIAAASAQPGGPADPAAPAATLAAVRNRGTAELTTTGRRTGKPHAVPVWFVVDGDVIYLSTLDPTRDWVRNAKQTPEVRLDFGGTVLAGQFRPVTDPAVDARIRQALRDKYWIAWVGGLFGKGPKETYVVEALHPAAL